MIKLADNVYAYEMIRPVTPGTDNERFTTNTLIVITSDGVLVADGQGSPADTQRLIEEIQKMTKQPIKYYVMGSEHGDHTGGNPCLSVEHDVHFSSGRESESRTASQCAEPRARMRPKVVVPTETVSDKRVLTMGEHGNPDSESRARPHGHDLVVYLPKEKVLFMSEVYFHRLFPAVRSGYPDEWIEAVKKAEKMDVRLLRRRVTAFVDDAAKT